MAYTWLAQLLTFAAIPALILAVLMMVAAAVALRWFVRLDARRRNDVIRLVRAVRR
jgi:hypothetical protein